MKISDYLYCTFTRRIGFVDVKTSLELNEREQNRLITQALPQGSSPQESIKMMLRENDILVSYYSMTNVSDAIIVILILEGLEPKLQIPYWIFSEKSIKLAIQAKEENWLINKLKNRVELTATQEKEFEILDENTLSSLFYSILTGDNIILISEEHEKRIKFLATIGGVFPVKLMEKNKITTWCKEFEGNQNILGIDQSSKDTKKINRFRLQADLIFVDLDSGILTGEGAKDAPLTDELAKMFKEGKTLEIVRKLNEVCEASTKGEKTKGMHPQDVELYERIKSVLTGEEMEKTQTGWFVDF
ncbi:MAG: hypothetical protein ACTSYA_03305 [Candidatus Kariarchaeaceae archaeon]